MAILDKTKKDDAKKKTPAAPKATKSIKISDVGKANSMDYLSKDDVLRRPYITEKAALAAERNAYTFEISSRANKIDVKKAMKALYNVDVLTVRIINLPNKTVMRKGKKGVKSGTRKAIVQLHPGDKIEFV